MDKKKLKDTPLEKRIAISKKFQEKNNGIPNKYLLCTGSESILFKTFYNFTKDIWTNDNDTFLDRMCATILCGVENPCITNTDDQLEILYYNQKEKEPIFKMNRELFYAESLEETEELIEKAKKEGINVRDEFVSIFHFVKDLQNVKDSFQSSGKKAWTSFAAAIQAMSSLYDLAIVEYSLEHQEIICKTFHDHNNIKEYDFLLKLIDFQFYIHEIEDKWHSKDQKNRISCERASEFIFKKYKDNSGFKKFFQDYYQIDCTYPKNRSTCIKKMAELTKEYRLRLLSKSSEYAYKPQKRKGRSVESRKKSSEGQKRAIERKKNESTKSSE